VQALLGQANDAYREGLAEQPAWQALARRRRRRRAVRQYGVLAGAAACGLGLLWLGRGGNPGERALAPALEPEPPGVLRVEPLAVPHPVPDVSPDPPTERPASIRSAPDISGAAVITEARCRERLEAGAFEEARRCFSKVARGGGLEADVALLEQARLSLERFSDGARALELLDSHLARFPASPMRGEAAELRVHALFALGRARQALAESEELLAAPWARSLAPGLRWLRGRIYEEQLGDCGSAATEYLALLGEPGSRGDEAELRRARCLERLGRAKDAEQAFQRYLGRDSPQHAKEAEESLERLRAPE
jgi:tetratricopeptide (TPR) repeat protein